MYKLQIGAILDYTNKIGQKTSYEIYNTLNLKSTNSSRNMAMKHDVEK
jgi:hypothetical protein